MGERCRTGRAVTEKRGRRLRGERRHARRTVTEGEEAFLASKQAATLVAGWGGGKALNTIGKKNVIQLGNVEKRQPGQTNINEGNV